MPGPVSDSYDPEFGTGDNAHQVANAIREVKYKISHALGDEQLKNILEVVQGKFGKTHTLRLTERELRILRFAINRALESI